MRILNTNKDQGNEPSEADIEELRRLFAEALKDPDGVIIISGPIHVDADGTIGIGKP
jgi:hypothetical protein